MNDVMIDLETMGNGPDAAIIAIGAVVFDIDAQTIGDRFHVIVDRQSSVNAGGVIDPSTIIWWMQQSDQARRVFNGSENFHIAEALQLFNRFINSKTSGKKYLRVWGCGSDFDNVILSSAYRRLYLEIPWLFWNNRCYRTVKTLHPDIKMERTGTHHNTVDDAESQARHLIQILNRKQP